MLGGLPRRWLVPGVGEMVWVGPDIFRFVFLNDIFHGRIELRLAGGRAVGVLGLRGRNALPVLADLLVREGGRGTGRKE